MVDNDSREQIYERAFVLGAATIHEASGQAGALPPQIKPVVQGMRVAGPAFPVSCSPGDNLFIHRAIASADPGDVLVIDVGPYHECGYIGDIMANAAVYRGIRGIVLNGCVRDRDALEQIGLPVFARGLSISGTTKRPDGRGSLRSPVSCGGTLVYHQDMVVADSDGVVVVQGSAVEDVMSRAEQRADHEMQVLQRLKSGATTLEIFGLPD